MKIETKFNKNDPVYFIHSANDVLPYINRGCVINVNLTKGRVTYDIMQYGLKPTYYDEVGEDLVHHTASEAVQYIAKEMEHRIIK